MLEVLVEASVDGVLAFDRELRYTQWNPAMERISGVPTAVAIGARALELFPFLVEIGEDRTFHAALPLASRTVAQPEAPPPDARRPGAGRHVLVVEDLPEASETLRAVPSILGCTVDIAADADAALAALARGRPDLVLCDIGLPGEMSGLDLARAIRRDPAHHGIRLVALTGYGTAGDRSASSDAGFDAHLTKPIEMKRIAQLFAELP